MSTRDEQYLQLAQERFDAELVKVAARLRKLADEITLIQTTKPDGTRRDPSLVVGGVTSTVLSGVANLRLELLSTWAEGIYEAERQAQK